MLRTVTACLVALGLLLAGCGSDGAGDPLANGQDSQTGPGESDGRNGLDGPDGADETDGADESDDKADPDGTDPDDAGGLDGRPVHPVNTGPWLPSLHMLDFLANDLGHQDICYAAYEHPQFDQYIDEQILPALQAHGLNVTMLRAPAGSDLAPLVDSIASEGCTAAMADGDFEPVGGGWRTFTLGREGA